MHVCVIHACCLMSWMCCWLSHVCLAEVGSGVVVVGMILFEVVVVVM